MKKILTVIASFFIAGCSVFGETGVETAQYKVLSKASDAQIEVREYDSLVLVSTPMSDGKRNGAFGKLFNYISGENVAASEIEMTSPVLMDDQKSGEKIEMTAPVLMDNAASEKVEMTAPVLMDQGAKNQNMMSFVLPQKYTLATAPRPKNPDVTLSEIKDYKVAAIIFNGTLSDESIAQNRKILERWIADNEYKIIGDYKTAGYNPPYTIPALRRNEVLIPVEKK